MQNRITTKYTQATIEDPIPVFPGDRCLRLAFTGVTASTGYVLCGKDQL
jgi:hypothetical protein